MKKLRKSSCSVLLAAAMLLPGGMTAFAASDTQCREGYLKDDPSEIEKLDITGQAVSDYAGSLPASVDLSNTGYFPEIGDQRDVGSCAAYNIKKK